MNNTNLSVFLLFCLIVVLECIALFFIKYAGKNKKPSFIPISVICYGLIAVVLYFIITKGENIATTNICWNILSTIYGLIIGVLIFNEKVSNLQFLGIMLGFLSFFLIFYKRT
jgi:multidrug transporter EmrE-like cation transporter